MRRLLILAALLVTALVIAACGGSGGDDSSGGDANASDSTGADSNGAGESVTRDQFIEMADAICAAGDELQGDLQAQIEAATSPEEAADLFAQRADQQEEAIDEITALPRPEGDEALIDELAAVQREGVELVRALADAVRANDQGAGEEIAAQIQQLSAEGDRGDEDFGFLVC